ncbi:MAG: hypothetical protein UU40_C0011G0019 [Candidatus Uhrbacteria bacterium GW2011_GWD2_41_121]|uniref:Uncharacterized protein n=1 Tax=Candidatus Uhrbacteria bacterium GW2011_GWC1_41_20 TaxID=1618983 RepID=A0A0G0XQ34_9BACT|nr:MAG: hypothetical protein UT52_C0013G0019 [Candidatus Uhrbacteria bacterium GW2011_GWE1_39_46]KKR63813.1 MAG: hypothetical protein UU04_C0011G0003 [Candidatus Uhrbacteria bacterium GW2011_GWC2_40_450]KKR89956.1 MAG: hypothetical protein UU40_C0011G0019 [Candidatus Uhrbacteria bacterium GW2011_GWD2_41_121]KKR95830.1 MAG: hypothetical protein UU46_C0013G0019 [Candidatus Uhrbacteria bacterium GW2011_GWD1_41_16]KKR98940.1 MAG: hypothetical protein UU50_C0013G0019 [Candidatus Uhrbacteria bacteriu
MALSADLHPAGDISSSKEDTRRAEHRSIHQKHDSVPAPRLRGGEPGQGDRHHPGDAGGGSDPAARQRRAPGHRRRQGQRTGDAHAQATQVPREHRWQGWSHGPSPVHPQGDLSPALRQARVRRGLDRSGGERQHPRELAVALRP